MQNATSSSQTFLMAELQKRLDRNPSYSVRAFARDLGISPASASEYLSGRHQISKRNAKKIAASLGLREHEEALLAGGEAQRVVDAETFAVISDWRHFAFLEYLKLGRKFSWRAVGRQLSTTAAGARQIVTRLEDLGFCQKAQGGYQLVQPDNQVFSATPSAAIRQFHRAVMERAITRLENHSMERRDVRSTIVSIDKAQVAAVAKLTAKFHRDLTKMLERSKHKDAIYCFASQFFQITEDLE